MTKSEQLANRLREVILNGTWIANTNFKDQLENLDWKIATKKIESLNSIAILAQHIHYYIAGMKKHSLMENLTLEINTVSISHQLNRKLNGKFSKINFGMT